MKYTVPYTVNAGAVSVFFNGRMYNIPSSDYSYEPLVKLLKSGSYTAQDIEDVVNKPAMIARAAGDRVKVVGNINNCSKRDESKTGDNK